MVQIYCNSTLQQVKSVFALLRGDSSSSSSRSAQRQLEQLRRGGWWNEWIMKRTATASIHVAMRALAGDGQTVARPSKLM